MGMKLSLSILAVMFVFIASNAQAVIISSADVEVDGTTYNVMSMYGDYETMITDLQNQPWWLDEDIARDFAAATGDKLGFPNGLGDGPYFAYDEFMGDVSYAFCRFDMGMEDCVDPDPSLDIQTFFADSDEPFYYVKASVVPVPAAVWLFMSGLLGLVWKGRKARQAAA